jgi:hypothetical protein
MQENASSVLPGRPPNDHIGNGDDAVPISRIVEPSRPAGYMTIEARSYILEAGCELGGHCRPTRLSSTFRPMPTVGSVTNAAQRRQSTSGWGLCSFLAPCIFRAAWDCGPGRGSAALSGTSGGRLRRATGGIHPRQRCHDLRLDPRTTLMDALREHLHLTGTKKGCDQDNAAHARFTSRAGASTPVCAWP